jgi:hypothetical protein
MSKLTVTILNAEGDEIALPAKHEVCPRCEGHGSHVNPAIDGNGITESEMYEAGEDFREDYMAGVYDVRCEECKGNRVVAVVNRDALTDEQRTALERHERAQEESARDDYSERYLRMQEGGWY